MFEEFSEYPKMWNGSEKLEILNISDVIDFEILDLWGNRFAVPDLFVLDL